MTKMVILTGAGISAESGVQTFRDTNGLWEGHKVEEVASPQGFINNPEVVHKFYNDRRKQLKTVEPNAAHIALAKLEEEVGDDFLLVTQNVDDLHERAGSKRVIHMHGELLKKRCVFCYDIIDNNNTDCNNDTSVKDKCENCQEIGGIRPHIVWFGEMPFDMATIENAIVECEVFVSIGTSGFVYPAAGFVELANKTNSVTFEINLKETITASKFDDGYWGKATEQVPRFQKEILKGMYHG